MQTFKQKAIEALKGMILKSGNTLTFQMVDQHNQTVRDCISRIEAIEEESNPVIDYLEKNSKTIDTEIQSIINEEFHNLI